MARGVKRIATSVREVVGLETVFHFHAASFVETPEEIETLVALTGIPLVFDTGHYLFGSGRVEGEVVLEGLRRLASWVRYVHLKDVDPRVAEEARRRGWNYLEALRNGLFTELGRGAIDFGQVFALLKELGYRGFATVEQDVLPGMGTPKESALRSRAYLRRVTGW